MKKYLFLNSFLLLIFLGCRNEPPPESEVQKRISQYLQSVNLPLEIEKIQVTSKRYNKQGKYHPIEIRFKGKIYSKDKNNILFKIDNIYDSKFYHIIYGYWQGHFNLVRFPPPDSIIYSLSSDHFSVKTNRIKIFQVDSLNNEKKFYPVKISLKKDGFDSLYTIPFSQDEFGIWKIGISDLITPESTVRTFLSEVNNGNTVKARRYFSYDYKLGYDEVDKNNLENLFPKGSIEDIIITDVYTENDTANLYLTVIKTDSDTFKTNLELIKLGSEWRFNYNGWDWKFKSQEPVEKRVYYE